MMPWWAFALIVLCCFVIQFLVSFVFLVLVCNVFDVRFVDNHSSIVLECLAIRYHVNKCICSHFFVVLCSVYLTIVSDCLLLCRNR